jgi:ATP-dependent helicase/DNAse subunit B
VSLRLITGPANAGKAGVVIDAVREAARAGREPLLVVPTGRDADVYRRELALAGVVFGVRVGDFGTLTREIGRRAGVRGHVIGPAQRDRLVAAAIARAEPRTMSATSGPGFRGAAGALIAELERALVTPQHLAKGLAAWAGEDTWRSDYARDLVAVYREYQGLLELLGRTDRDLEAWRALDALAADASRWGSAPVFLYGFDDLTGLQRRTVEVLAGPAGVDVTVAMTFEPDRPAFLGRARTFEVLASLPDAVVEGLAPRDDYYAPASRAALHALERDVFDPFAIDGDRVDAGEAVRLLVSGGERAEAELVGAEVLALLRAGMAPAEIAVVYRDPASAGQVLAQVFSAYGIPLRRERRVELAHIALGRGLLALLRVACAGGDARDLLAYMRTPGVLREQHIADRLEAFVSRRRVSSSATALEELGRLGWDLGEIERLRRAAGRGATQLIEELQRVVARTPGAGMALEAEDALVRSTLLDALAGLTQLAATDASLGPDAGQLLDLLGGLSVRIAEGHPAGVQLLGPLELRARRVRALFLCGLQEGEFPQQGRPEPFLSDDVRRALTRTGIELRLHEDVIDAERALFYACVSRPEAQLFLSHRTSDENGDPVQRSLFVDDVCDVLALGAATERPLSDVTWPLERAPTERERLRALALAGPRREVAPRGQIEDARVLEHVRAREAWSARALEAYDGCPTQWLVENVLRPEDLEPDSEAQVRGSEAHSLLERVLSEVGAVTEATLPQARRVLAEVLAERGPTLQLSAEEGRRRRELRRLELDLDRYLVHLSTRHGGLAPAALELSFGPGPDADHPPLDIGAGAGVSGRIDRVDADATGGVVYDYKGSSVYPVARWLEDGRLQVPLYMLAARALLGLEPVGGLYQPLGRELKARGVIREDSDLARHAVKNDRADAAEIDAVLAAVSIRASEAIEGIRAGAISPTPSTCGYRRDGCAYPGVCRCQS